MPVFMNSCSADSISPSPPSATITSQLSKIMGAIAGLQARLGLLRFVNRTCHEADAGKGSLRHGRLKCAGEGRPQNRAPRCVA
jgi:hypothetical protein